MNKNLKRTLLYIGIPIIMILSYFLMTAVTKKATQTKYYEIVQLVKNNKVSEFNINLYSGELTYKLRSDGKTYHYTVADASMFYNDVNDAVLEINQDAEEGNGQKIEYDVTRGGQGS